MKKLLLTVFLIPLLVACGTDKKKVNFICEGNEEFYRPVLHSLVIPVLKEKTRFTMEVIKTSSWFGKDTYVFLTPHGDFMDNNPISSLYTHDSKAVGFENLYRGQSTSMDFDFISGDLKIKKTLDDDAKNVRPSQADAVIFLNVTCKAGHSLI